MKTALQITTLLGCVSLVLSASAFAGPLHEAVKNNKPDEAKILISQGKSVNQEDEYQRTPLYWAAQRGHIPLANLLVSNKANVNQVSSNEDHWTPLIVAAYRGHAEMVDYLVKKDADIEAKDKDGYTALSWAFKEDHIAAATVLIKNGANVKVPSASEYGPPKHSDDTLINDAVMQGDQKFIELLLIHGADVNRVDAAGYSPLHHAVHGGDLETVKLLVKRGADTNFKADGGFLIRRGMLMYSDLTPLQVAELYEEHIPGPREDIVEYLRDLDW